ncbi:MAG TPA: cytochrome c biogenesis protein CcsA [Thermomicrobiaceae bacterium]|nr:cytochrome c biogenesis protein CcsA [Thermomicrobiaceae bacterium]
MTENRRWVGLTAILGVASLLLVSIAVYMALVYAPTDAVQGQPQRLFYLHVPIAWVGFLSWFIVFVGAIGYLVKRDRRFDQVSRSAAEIGLIFLSLVLLTGSIWGRPIWGTWWVWDARLTTTLILWFIGLAYFLVRGYVNDPDKAARYSAVVGIIGFIDVPIIYESVNWWRTLHPTSVMDTPGGPAMPGSMLITLLVSLLAFTVLYACLMSLKISIEHAKDVLAERAFALAERMADLQQANSDEADGTADVAEDFAERVHI